MTKIAGIDFGLKRIGIAFSDSMQMIATPHTVLEIKGAFPSMHVKEVTSLLAKNTCSEVVIGLPLHMDGKESEMCQYVYTFEKALQREGFTTSLFDERMTSLQASALLQPRFNTKKQKKILDAVSASILLQTYLDRKKSC